jgi:hypothetical protein
MKNANLYLLWMQSSAAAPQASHRIWCRFAAKIACNPHPARISGRNHASQRVMNSKLNQFALVEKQKEFSSVVLTTDDLSSG